jgi:hypothetical protein
VKKEDLKKFISNTNKSNITNKMLDLPSHAYDLMCNIEILEDQLRNKNHELDVIESKRYRDISTTYKNVKSMTATVIGHHINSTPEVISRKKEIIELSKKLGLVKAKLKAITLFAEMLTNVGHQYRTEQKTIKKGV